MDENQPKDIKITAAGIDWSAFVALPAAKYGPSPLKTAYGAFSQMEAMMTAVMEHAQRYAIPWRNPDRFGLATEYPDLRDAFERKLAETPLARWEAEVGEP